MSSVIKNLETSFDDTYGVYEVIKLYSIFHFSIYEYKANRVAISMEHT